MSVARLPRFAPALVAAGLTAAVGLSQAQSDLRSDDWTYLAWARASPQATAFLTAPPPFPYYRPLNALAWWAQEHFAGASPWPIEGLLLLAWAIAMGCLYAIVARRAGPVPALVAVTLALCTLELRDLPNWRSWLTTTGGLAGVLAGVLLADRGRPGLALLAVALGAGFKEGAWWQGAWALAAVGELPVAGVALAAFVVHAGITGSWHQPGEIAASHVAENLPRVAAAVLGWAWPVPLLTLAALAPREAWRGGPARLVLAGLAAMLPVLGFYLYNPYYIVEAACLLLLALVPVAGAGAARRPRVGAAVAVLTALWFVQPGRWEDYHENVGWQAWVHREGRALAERGVGARAAWAPDGDEGPCGLAARLLTHDGATLLAERPPDGEALADCLVIRR